MSCGSPMPRGERIAKPAEWDTRLAGLFSSRRVLRRGIGQKEERMAPCRLLAIVGGGLAAVVSAGCKDSHSPPASITVTAVSPASGPLAGGTNVTITGSNFANVTSVTIGGNELGSRTVVTATQITGTTLAATKLGASDV